MIRSIGDLINYLNKVLEDDEWLDVDSGIMLNVAGRWTGIKGITSDQANNLFLLESED
jgi:hypothetical protein